MWASPLVIVSSKAVLRGACRSAARRCCGALADQLGLAALQWSGFIVK